MCPQKCARAATDEDHIIDWSLEEVTPGVLRGDRDRRARELGIKEKYVRKSLQFLISESIKKITKYDHQLRQIRDENDPKRLNIVRATVPRKKPAAPNFRSGSRIGWPRSSRNSISRRSRPKSWA